MPHEDVADLTLTGFFRRQAASASHARAFLQWRTLSADGAEATKDSIAWSAAVPLVEHTAVRLQQECGVRSGAKVCVLSDNCPAIVLLMFALWRLGAIAVPLPISSSDAQIRAMLEIVRPSLLLRGPTATQESARLHATATDIDAILAMRDLLANQSQTVEERALHPDTASPTDAALWLFTSSGISAASLKCVEICHRALVAGAVHTADSFGIADEPQTVVAWAPLSHAMNLATTLLAASVATCGTYVFAVPQTATDAAAPQMHISEVVMQCAEQCRATYIELSPVILSAWAKQGDEAAQRLVRLRLPTMFVGGAPPSTSHWQWADQHRLRLYQAPGSTEAAGCWGCSRFTPANLPRGAIKLRADLKSSLHLLRISADETEADVSGELILESRNIAVGYAHTPRPSTALQRTGDNTVYSTGDIFYAHADPDVTGSETFYSYFARKDDLIHLESGDKVPAITWEIALDAQPGVHRSFVSGNVVPRESDAFALPGPSQHLLALIEADGSSNSTGAASIALAAVSAVNKTMAPVARIQHSHVRILPANEHLPVTGKQTLFRKKIWAGFETIWANATPCHFESRIKTPTRTPKVAMVAALQESLASVFGLPDSFFSGRWLQTTLAELGLSSTLALKLSRQLSAVFETRITPADLYDTSALSDLLSLSTNDSKLAAVSEPHPIAAALDRESVSVIGSALRLPGGIDNLAAFWRHLNGTSEALPDVDPRSRWKGCPLDGSDLDAVLPRVSFLANDLLTDFDAAFFRISKAESVHVSPSCRLLLRLAHEALEDANIPPSSLRSRAHVGANGSTPLPVGVWVTQSDPSAYKVLCATRAASQHSLYDRHFPLNACDASLAGRISHFFDLQGPSVTVNSACSSSALALHQARQAILAGECEYAIVGAVTTFTWPGELLALEKAGLLSLKGRCASFSAEADGFRPSEGAAVVILSKQSWRSRGDIVASTIMHDGTTQGMAAPSKVAQARLLERTLEAAGVSAAEVSAVECHGTGTVIGDEVELGAIISAYKSQASSLLLGSVKAVVGHTQEASGLFALLKVLLSLQHQIWPPLGHHENLVEAVQGGNLRMPQVPARLAGPYVGLSSFGLTGTIGHLLVRAPRGRRPITTQRDTTRRVLCISAPSPASLAVASSAWTAYLRTGIDLNAACLVSQIARDHYAHRLCIPAPSIAGAVAALSSSQAQEGSTAGTATVILPHNLAGYEAQVQQALALQVLVPGPLKWHGFGTGALTAAVVTGSLCDRAAHNIINLLRKSNILKIESLVTIDGSDAEGKVELHIATSRARRIAHGDEWRVLTGEHAELTRLCAQLGCGSAISTQRVEPLPLAAQIDEIATAFETASASPRQASNSLSSSMTGRLLPSDTVVNAGYLARMLAAPIRMPIASGSTLLWLGDAPPEGSVSNHIYQRHAASVSRVQFQNDRQIDDEGLATCYNAGLDINWPTLYGDQMELPVAPTNLPHTPFDPRRAWP